MAAALDAEVDASVVGAERKIKRGHYHEPDACNYDFVQFVLDMKPYFRAQRKGDIVDNLGKCVNGRSERMDAIIAGRKGRIPTPEELREDAIHVDVRDMFALLKAQIEGIAREHIDNYRFVFVSAAQVAAEAAAARAAAIAARAPIPVAPLPGPRIRLYPNFNPADAFVRVEHLAKQADAEGFEMVDNGAKPGPMAVAQPSNAAAAPAGSANRFADLENQDKKETAKERAAREKLEKAHAAAMAEYEVKLAKWNSDAAVTARRKTWDSKRNQAKTAEQLALFKQRNGEDFDPDKGKPEPPKPGGRRRTRRRHVRRRTQKKK